jgi:hypothetical protein
MELVHVDWQEAVAQGTEAEAGAATLAALDVAGFVVLEHALPGEDCDQLVREMQPYLDATPHGLHGLGGTRRCGALVARSPASHKMVMHPAILKLVNAVLGEQRLKDNEVTIGGHRGKGDSKRGIAYPWQLHLTQVIEVGPGGGGEEAPHGFGASNGQAGVTNLHNANGMWVHNFGAKMDLQVEVMWALTDFTEENGATWGVLGSHRMAPPWGPAGFKRPAVQAIMPKGSVMIWTGWSIHGAGVNRTADARRTGMNINYSLAFLAQEENQLLTCPPHLARKLPRELQRMIGYFQPSGSLNYVAECQAPEESVLREGYDVLVPGAHLHQLDPETDGTGPVPRTPLELADKLAALAALKADAVAADDLELAQHYKNAAVVLRQSAELAGTAGEGGSGGGAAESTTALARNRRGGRLWAGGALGLWVAALSRVWVGGARL